MLVQRITLELSQNLDFKDAGVDKIVQHEVDNAVGSAKMYCRLGAVAGEWLQAASLATGHNHTKDVFLMFPRIRPTHITS